MKKEIQTGRCFQGNGNDGKEYTLIEYQEKVLIKADNAAPFYQETGLIYRTHNTQERVLRESDDFILRNEHGDIIIKVRK